MVSPKVLGGTRHAPIVIPGSRQQLSSVGTEQPPLRRGNEVQFNGFLEQALPRPGVLRAGGSVIRPARSRERSAFKQPARCTRARIDKTRRGTDAIGQRCLMQLRDPEALRRCTPGSLAGSAWA